jgi:hypothetical protein
MMMKLFSQILAVSLLLSLCGCGGGGITNPPTGGGGSATYEWTFDQPASTRMGLWSAEYTEAAVDVSLSGTGVVTVIAYTPVFAGTLTAPASRDGSFSAVASGVAFVGKATHNGTHVELYRTTLPNVKHISDCQPVASDAYSDARGTWTGTLLAEGGTPVAVQFVADDAGLISGTLGTGAAAKPVTGFVSEDGGVGLTALGQDTRSTYMLYGSVASSGGHVTTISGTFVSKELAAGIHGTWTASATTP